MRSWMQVAALTLAVVLAASAAAEDEKPKAEAAEKKPPEREPTVVDLALAWLARHQLPDGRWSANELARQCEGEGCGGAAAPPGTVDLHAHAGLTGEVVSAFLGYGETHQRGVYKVNVKNGLRYLHNVQRENGSFADEASPRLLLDHTSAALAMTEAYGMTGSKLFREPAIRAVRFVTESQNDDGGWGFRPRDGKSDLEPTARAVTVLKSAQLSELPVLEARMRRALTWLDGHTDPKTGDVKETALAKGRPVPAPSPEMRTARGVLMRFFGHADRAAIQADPLLETARKRLTHNMPKPDRPVTALEVATRTYACFQGGERAWKKWNAWLKEHFVGTQDTAPACRRGSWDPTGPQVTCSDRILATTLCARSLEVYYMYRRYEEAPDDDGKKGE